MKRISTFILALLTCCLWACNDSAEKTAEIAPVSNISYEAGNGTLLFHWDKPLSSDLAYTEISYVNDDGKARKVLVDANLTQQLIRGFGSSQSYEFKFVTYSRSGNASEPITFFANPLEPLMNIFNGKVKVTVDFGGVHLSWDNVHDEDFYIDMEYSDINGNEYKEEVLAPANATGSTFIPVGSKLEGTQTIDIYTYISDLYGNQSAPNVIKFFKLEAGKFDRSLWTVTPSSEEKDAPATTTLDGLASTFWHSNWTGAGSSFAEGHYLIFDMQAKKRIEKIELQHRQNKVMARGIELYGTNTFTGNNDKTQWELCGSFDMDQDNKALQVFDLPNAVEFRYLKVCFTTAGTGDSTYAGLAEFAAYGQDITE